MSTAHTSTHAKLTSLCIVEYRNLLARACQYSHQDLIIRRPHRRLMPRIAVVNSHFFPYISALETRSSPRALLSIQLALPTLYQRYRYIHNLGKKLSYSIASIKILMTLGPSSQYIHTALYKFRRSRESR